MYTAKYPGHPGLKTGTLKPTVKLTLKRSPEPHRQGRQVIVAMPIKLAHLADVESPRQLIKRAHLANKLAHLAEVESPRQLMKRAHLAEV